MHNLGPTYIHVFTHQAWDGTSESGVLTNNPVDYDAGSLCTWRNTA